MSQNSKNHVKTTLYLDANAHALLCDIRDAIGTPVAESIRRAVSEKLGLAERSPEDCTEIAIVRRAILAGGTWRTSEDEMGTNIEGRWCDPVTGKDVDIKAIICSGKAEHSVVSIGWNVFGIGEVLSKQELAAANKALRIALKASRAGKRVVRK